MVQRRHISSSRPAGQLMMFLARIRWPEFKQLQVHQLLILLLTTLFSSSLCLDMTCLESNVNNYLESKNAGSMEKYLMVENNLKLVKKSILIEVSNRTSHQLIGRITRILLRDVLHYKLVDLVNSSEASNDYTFCSTPNFDKPPHSIMNLEAWVPVTYNPDVMKNFKVSSVGTLGALGKFGWYVPKYMEHNMWWNHSMFQCGHSLMKEDFQDTFSSDSLHRELRQMAESEAINSNFSTCGNFSDCIFHSSLKCSTPGACMVLVAPDYSSYGSCLVELIIKMKLDITVMWIGEQLTEFVLKKYEEGVPVMYFGWNMDLLSVSGKFTRICMPEMFRASRLREGIVNNCDWEVKPIQKFIWTGMRKHIPDVYVMLSQMELTNSDVSDLLRSYFNVTVTNGDGSYKVNTLFNNETLEQVACQWVKSNEEKWSKWFPSNIYRKLPIYIGGLFSLTGKYLRDKGGLTGAKEAVKFINADPSILPHHNLVLLQGDSSDSRVALEHSMSFLTNDYSKVHGLLDSGSLDTEEIVAQMARIYLTPVISYNSRSSQMSDRNFYPYFFRINSILRNRGPAIVNLIKSIGWKRVGLFIEHYSKSVENYGPFFKNLFAINDIQVAYDAKVEPMVNLSNIYDSLEHLKKKRVNIIVAIIENKKLPAFLCVLREKRMLNNNNYVWMFLTSLTDNWWILKKDNSALAFLTTMTCSQSMIVEALQSHFVFEDSFIYKDNEPILIGNKSVELWKKTLEEEDKKTPGHNTVTESAPKAFDAVLTYAKAFHELLKNHPRASLEPYSLDTIKEFVTTVENLKFNGITGPIEFNEADRLAVVEVKQMQLDQFQQVGVFKDASFSGLTGLVWKTASGKHPPDTLDENSQCGVESIRAMLGVECDTALIIINFSAVTIFLVPLITTFVCVLKRYDKKIKKIQRQAPQIAGWELNRNEIILNRKIGQGEFGTVFGGEAKVKQNWLAVAVKTLKPGSTTDDKVDFFSEARLMKDFDHENIVKLLGVCTIGDPALVVMEFMLHGDLRSYLLSRRHLVNETSEEAMDISPQAITKMALDVARGLKYLTNLGFVHRDLACRNCLVHETGIVKIGDFGLTENVYSSGYVRCTSNGKFPVRWMAPESLNEGVFTSASDIWSLGILIYEIFTFGTVPYHGCTNEEVVVFVKNHKTIELPSGCPENLRRLLDECWSPQSECRPTIDVIIDQLESMPLLLVPCLDAPRPQFDLDAIAGNAGLVVNFTDPRLPNSSRSQRPGKHKTSLPLINGRPMKSIGGKGPEKSPDVCSPHSVRYFEFSTPTEEDRGAPEFQRITLRDNCCDDSKDSAVGCSLRNSDEVGNETNALLCNGCDRSFAVPIFHRSISTEPTLSAKFKKSLDSKTDPDITSGIVSLTCRTPSGPLNYVTHQQGRPRHSRNKNSNTSSSPAL